MPLNQKFVTLSPPSSISLIDAAMKVRTTLSFFLAMLLTTHLCGRRAAALGFNCSSATTHTCQSMVGYIASTNTTLDAVATKFGLRSYAVLLGPNSLPLNASGHHPVGSGQTVRVPIPCRCTNGTGYSDRVPVYTVQDKDKQYLYVIATEVFSSLVDFQSIATVNRIPDPNTIHNGQRLWIPLPCSCDPVGKRFPVIHYAHVVLPGSTLDGIAAQFGDDEGQIMKLNGIEDPNLLAAGQVLDIPLRVCSSQIRNSSLDKSLAVAGGGYALTAHNCVQCKCSNSWQLQCEPNPVANTSACPSMHCKGTSMVIGDSVTGAGCGSPTCSYAGYTNQSILTAITAGPTCVPAAAPTLPPTGAPPPLPSTGAGQPTGAPPAQQPSGVVQPPGVPSSPQPTDLPRSSAPRHHAARLTWLLTFYATLAFLSSAFPWQC